MMKSYCFQVLPGTDCNATACEVISRLFFMSDDSQSPSFIEVLLEIVRRKIKILDEGLRVVYNKNHVKHFCTLPWWFKSNVLLEYISEKEFKARNNTRREESPVDEQPVEKRHRLEDDDITEDLDIDSFHNPNDSLASFCKETQKQVITVHGICKKLDIELEKQKLKNAALNELLEQALMDEDFSITNVNY